MKKVEIVTKTSVEVNIGGKPVNSYLSQIANLCHDSLELSTSKQEEYETLYEDNMFEEACSNLENRVSILESAICEILNYLED